MTLANPNHSGTKARYFMGWLSLFLAAGLLYGLTCARGSAWQDSGMIQYRVWHNDIEGKLGLALAHPLFYLLAIGGKYVLPGEFGFRVNLVSALIGAAAVANLFLLLYLWLGQIFPAIIGAGSLALSHTFWQHAAWPETYNLYVALLLGELIMLLQYSRTQKVGWLYGLALLNGLSIADHMLGSIAMVCYLVLLAVLLIKRTIRLPHLAIMTGLWVMGALPYEYLIVKSMVATGDFWGTLASAAFGQGWKGDVLNTTLTLRIVKENILYLAMNFPTINILLCFVGLYGLWSLAPKRFFAWIIMGLTVMFLGFAFRYTIVDRYAFFIPFYAMVALLMGVGSYWVLQRLKQRTLLAIAMLIFLVMPVGAYAAAPTMAKEMGVKLGTRRQIPFRDDYAFFLQPWQAQDKSPVQFAQMVMDTVPSGAIVYADNTTIYPLLYQQEVMGQRPDICFASGHFSTPGTPEFTQEYVSEALRNGHGVYVVSNVEGYCPEFIMKEYALTKVDKLWQVVKRPM